MAVIGTCSICGGAVTVPDVWYGINPPIPQCSSCNAVASSHGPVIPMRAPPDNGVYAPIGTKPASNEREERQNKYIELLLGRFTSGMIHKKYTT